MRFSLVFVQILLVIHYSGANSGANNAKEIKYCDANARGSCEVVEPTIGDIPDGCFRAAVYEHDRDDLVSADESARSNLATFRDVAKIAAQSGASIIVFPEDGLIYGDASYLAPALTEIPDPELLQLDNNNPCLQSDLFNTSVILRNLSCIARENNLYVVANFGTKQNCEPKSKVLDRICPDVGYFALNTDVVLDPKGAFIKRYRKFNMFVEVFDRAPSLETTYFDTPLGRFGIFTCFDILFKRPAIELVEKHHIDTALFPTLWYDELPLLSAIQFQDAWSWTNKVNLLSANIHKRYMASVGSGIFSGYNSIYTGPNDTNSRLMIATIPKKHSLNFTCQFDPLMINIKVENSEINYDHKHFRLQKIDALHFLQSNEGNHTICTGQVCCTIDYKVNPEISSDKLNRLVVIARDGLRDGIFNWYEQICSIATLKSSIDLHTIEQANFSMEGFASFDRLSLKGTFTSKYVYPIAAFRASELMPRMSRDFTCDQLGTEQDNMTSCSIIFRGTSDKKPIYSFGMYSRVYESDKMPKDW